MFLYLFPHTMLRMLLYSSCLFLKLQDECSSIVTIEHFEKVLPQLVRSSSVMSLQFFQP